MGLVQMSAAIFECLPVLRQALAGGLPLRFAGWTEAQQGEPSSRRNLSHSYAYVELKPDRQGLAFAWAGCRSGFIPTGRVTSAVLLSG